MKKLLLRIVLTVLVVLLSIWGIAVLKCEIMTFRFGEEFSTIYQENSMLGEIDYLKVLSYSGSHARVYYVSQNRSGGNVLVFQKQDDKWGYKNWERTVWSKQGSADGFIWPYFR